MILLRADDLTVLPVSDPAGTIVAAGHPGLVDTVLVAGQVVKRDGALVGVDLAGLKEQLVSARTCSGRAEANAPRVQGYASLA